MTKDAAGTHHVTITTGSGWAQDIYNSFTPHKLQTMCTCLQGHTAENCSSVTVILIPSFYFHLILVVFIIDIEHLMMMGRNVVMRGQSDVE